MNIHGRESRDFREQKLQILVKKHLDLGKTFFDIYVITRQICMGFKADILE